MHHRTDRTARTSTRHRPWVVGALATLVATVLGLAVLAVPAEAASTKPGGLRAVGVSTTALTFTWKPVRKAVSYDVEVSASSSFDDRLFSVRTTNTRATPTVILPLGRLYWRVRANLSRKTGRWSVSSIAQQQRPGPIPVSPAPDAVLSQPEAPPVLTWQPIGGAEQYIVEIDGAERDWVDTELITTRTTSTVVNEPQPNGVYWWRVRAVLDRDILTRPSQERRYTIGPLGRVRLHPTPSPMEEVVLSWDRVPGAADYEIRVSTDNDFNNIVYRAHVAGTHYSPPKTYDNASYWWQVRARNALGQSEEWPTYPDRTGEFRRAWNVTPQLTYPAEAAAASEDLLFQWEPVRLAEQYQLYVGTDPGFSNSRYFNICPTTQTTYTPGRRSRPRTPDKCLPTHAGTWYWRIQAIDGPTDVDSVFSEVRSFEYLPPTRPAGDPGAVDGERLTIHGRGSSPCVRSLERATGVCQGVTETPTLHWDPVPGAAYYLVYLAHNPELTNIVTGYGDSGRPDTLPMTVDTRWTPVKTLRDTQAGEAYYWFVRACDSSDRCGLTPSLASNAFEKKSAPVGLAPVTDASGSVTFRWSDYLATNQAATDPSTGEHPGQAAAAYHLQVSDTETFTRLLDDVEVDQTTYTAFAKTYPEGVLWWRVQAVDGSGNDLTWSQPQRFTKASPTPTALGPTGGQVVAGVQPFRWLPTDGAKLYDVEVYRNADTTASPGNRVAYARNVRQTAFAFDRPLQALGTDFVWRVRRSDFSGHDSAWSIWHRFRVAGPAPVLVSPASGRKLPGQRTAFSWRATPQAAAYFWQLRRGSSIEKSVRTQATVYAPTYPLLKGRWQWRVVSLDSNGDALRASGWRKFTARK